MRLRRPVTIRLGRRFLGTDSSPLSVVWGPTTISLGTGAALLGFVAIALLAVGDRRNGKVGILGLVVLFIGIILVLVATATVYLS